MEDGVLHIQCEKVKPGESCTLPASRNYPRAHVSMLASDAVSCAPTGTSAIAGHESTDVLSQEEDKKAMMLQRFQKENPGFDFSGA